VPYVFKKRERIIPLVKQRRAQYLKCRHKFGIEVPTSVKDAYALDEKNGNTYWANSATKEMKNVKVAFDILTDG